MKPNVEEEFKKWGNETAAFIPREGADFSWVFDYAKYRFAWAESAVALIEGKALNLLRLNLLIVAAGWTLANFEMAHGAHPALSRTVVITGLFAAAAFAAASVLSALVSVPRWRPGLPDEMIALGTANRHAPPQALGKMAHALAFPVRFELLRAASKGKLLVGAIWCEAGALILALTSIFVSVLCR